MIKNQNAPDLKNPLQLTPLLETKIKNTSKAKTL